MSTLCRLPRRRILPCRHLRKMSRWRAKSPLSNTVDAQRRLLIEMAPRQSFVTRYGLPRRPPPPQASDLCLPSPTLRLLCGEWRAVSNVAIPAVERRIVPMSVSETTAPPGGGLLASILSEDTFRPAEPKTIEETGLTGRARREPDPQVRDADRLGQRPADRRQHLPAVRHSGTDLPVAPPAAAPGQQRQRPAQRLQSTRSPTRAASGPAVAMETVQLHRRGTGAARRLHRLGRGPDDSRRSAAAAAPAKGVRRYLRRAGHVRHARPRREQRRRPVPLRCAGQRQDDARQAHHDVLRQLDLDSPRRSPKTASSSSCSTPPTTSRSTTPTSSLLKSAEHDRRWIKISGPTVVVGGELTLDALEIRHDPISNVSEASLQLKSNCGCLLIDDFGRQRISPDGPAQPLDRAARKPHRLPDAGDRQEDSGAVRAAHHLLDEPGADRPGRRSVPAPHSVQDRSRRSVARRVPDAVQAHLPRACTASISAEAVDYLIDKHYEPLSRPAAPLPAARPSEAGPQLLRL